MASARRLIENDGDSSIFDGDFHEQARLSRGVWQQEGMRSRRRRIGEEGRRRTRGCITRQAARNK